MTTRSAAVGSLFAAALLATAGCLGTSRYSRYRSPFFDFQCEVPTDWKIVVDSGGRDYYQISFLGPLDSAFYRGVPSLSVRWYRLNAPHRLPDGSYEMYSSAQDFMDQTLREIYGPDGYYKGGDDEDQERHMSKGEALPDFEKITMIGDIPAMFFVAYHNMPAPSNVSLGVVDDEAGHRILRERHGYAVIPLRDGFYVLTYPATRNGYANYKKDFLVLIKSFRLVREGPK